jgi:hypothetical protein
VNKWLEHCCVSSRIANRTEDNMSDSDDSDPIRPGAKRRRIYSRLALVSVPYSVATNKAELRSPTSTSNEVSESDAMIARLRAKFEAKIRSNQHAASAASAAQMQVDHSRSALREQKLERDELEAALTRRRAEI